MTDRSLCRALSIALWCIALAGWVAFFLLFRHGGPLYTSPTEAKATWVVVLVGLLVVVNWSSRPDRAR